LLDRQIPIVLIESVGAGNRHYRDFASVVDLSYAMLRRITGKNFPDQAPAWATWWRDHGPRFRARRELLRVEESDIPETIIEWFPPRATKVKPIRFTVVGPLRPTFLHGTALAVTGEQMQGLVDLLISRDFFSEPEMDPRNVPADQAIITLRVGDLSRTTSYGSDEEDVDFRNVIRERVLGLARDLGWQLWQDLDEQPSWELFFAENNRWFTENTDADVRDARLREMVAKSLDNILDTQDRLRAVRFIALLPGAGKALSGPQAEAFIRVIAREQEVTEFTREAVDLLVPDAGANVAVGLIDALASRVGPDAHTLLVHLCLSLEQKRVAQLTADERWKVRRAAVSALGEMDADLARPVLVARLSDEEVMVRLAAAEELARMKDPTVLPSLAALKSDRSSEVRAAAAHAFGLLGSKPAREGIIELLYRDPSPRVRTSAIRGLVEGGAPEVVPLLLGVFRTEADVRVRAAAASGIVSMESPELVKSLLDRMQLTSSGSAERVALVNILARFQSDRTLPVLRSVLRGDDTSSADAAALGLARR
jgi:HEAT repeat protein